MSAPVEEPYSLVDVFAYQDGGLRRFRCARSLDGMRWSVVCADNVSGPFSAARLASQQKIFAELINEMHPFDRMRPGATVERALADWGSDDEATSVDE